VPLNDSNISKADYSFASANTAEGSESAFDTLTLSEANNHKADYSDVSSKPDESAADVRSYPQARNPNLKPADPDSGQVREVLVEELSVESQEPPPIADLPALAVPTPADAKPWTADELQTVYACGSAYMEHDTPPDKFATNCELAADGHAAAEVIAYLKSKLAQKRYRPGGRFGPSSWNWFYAVLRERFSASERGHLPEQPAVAHVAHQATAEAMDRGYDALGSPVLANA